MIPKLLPLADATRATAIGHGVSGEVPYISIEGLNAHAVSQAIVDFVCGRLHGVVATFTEGTGPRSHRFRIGFVVWPEEHGVPRGGPMHRGLHKKLLRIVRIAAFEAMLARDASASARVERQS